MDKLTVAGADMAATISSFGSPLLTTLGDNRIVDNLNFIGANLRDGGYGEEGGGRRRSKKGRRPSFFKPLEPYEQPRVVENLTLREKAELFRQRNPEKWERRVKEKEEQRRLDIGIIDTHPILKNYVESQLQRVRQKKLIEARRKLLPRTVNVEIKFNISKQASPRSISLRRKSDLGPELSLTVIKGKNLFNHSGETEERSEKCCVKAQLLPGGEKDKNKSDYRYLTTNGTTCWERIFSFPVLSRDQMASKYILISITGQTRAGEKKLIGNAAIAGREALIQMEDYKARKPIESEMIELEKTFDNPEAPVLAQLVLYPKDWTGMKDLTIIQQEPPPRGRRASILGKNKIELNLPEGSDLLQSTTEELEEGGENEGEKKEDADQKNPPTDLTEEVTKTDEVSNKDSTKTTPSEDNDKEQTNSTKGDVASTESEKNSDRVENKSQEVVTPGVVNNDKNQKPIASEAEKTSPVVKELSPANQESKTATDAGVEQKSDEKNQVPKVENKTKNSDKQHQTTKTVVDSDTTTDTKSDELLAQHRKETGPKRDNTKTKADNIDVFADKADERAVLTDDEHFAEFKRGKVVRKKKRSSADDTAAASDGKNKSSEEKSASETGDNHEKKSSDVAVIEAVSNNG